MSLPGVGPNELIDEFFDGGICGTGGWELAEVFGGFECDHVGVPPCGWDGGFSMGVNCGDFIYDPEKSRFSEGTKMLAHPGGRAGATGGWEGSVWGG